MPAKIIFNPPARKQNPNHWNSRNNLRYTAPEDLVGRQIYFRLSKAKMAELEKSDNRLLDLTPGKLYTIKSAYGDGWLFTIHDDVDYPRTIWLGKNANAAELSGAATWILKSLPKEGAKS